MVVRCGVEKKEIHWIAQQWVFLNDDHVSLKESVGLVARQEKQETNQL